MKPICQSAAVLMLAASAVLAGDANRLTYLDDSDPYYVDPKFPKLTTPQWVGDSNVECVIILSIDDMTEPARYEKFLRPILDRLKKIDGRAPVSILCKQIKPMESHYQEWLKEGLSLEVHTLTHPCPILAESNFPAASGTFFGSIFNVDSVPGNKAVAFRTPCCDSINSPSPRLFAELFNHTNAQGQFLTIDSSVMNIPSREKLGKYLPFPAFQTTVEDYPFPYVIGRFCWEFPPVVPSDWEAFHLHGANNPETVADWKAALDDTVSKQGVFTLIFHPHGWIRNDQLTELVDYADKQHGAKVKFLNFREAQERIDANLLKGQHLRDDFGEDNGVRLLDLNNDGFIDVVIGNEQLQVSRIWNPRENKWVETGFPVKLVSLDAAGRHHDAGVRFGIVTPDGFPSIVVRNDTTNGAWTFDGGRWVENPSLLDGLELDAKPVSTSLHNCDRGVRFRDVDLDGIDELIVGNDAQNAVFAWSVEKHRWKQLDYALPPDTGIVDAEGRDSGLRFVDVNGDGFEDVVYSDAKRYSVNLFVPKPVLGFGVGWSRTTTSGQRDHPERTGSIPPFVREGPHPNNGAWFHNGSLWVQNEDTAKLPDEVDRRSFKELMAGKQPPPKSPEDSLAAITVRPGFKVELVASEPLTKSPIAFDWGADGKFWIVEMGDYPLGLDGNGKPGGIIRYLEDSKGDGHYDKSTVFLDGLPFPTGIIPWGKGVIVCDPPEIFYAESSAGTGRADIRRTLFKGFVEGNQQHRANGFDYGLDNWIYGGNGDSGGNITSILTGETVNISGRDFRFRPDTGEFEAEPGETQYGRHRDDWGNWFGVNNPSEPWHYFLPERYVKRNPFLLVRDNKQVTAKYDDDTRVYPTSQLMERFNDPSGANHLTSACSPVPYRDELFGPDFANAIFVCEPVHNLVHRENLVPDGVSFTSHRALNELQSEFFSSSDNWTRPVMAKTGPDGAVYIADMYRLIIEHPEWIPKDIQRSVDLRAGADKGRIYRVFPADAPPRPFRRLDKLNTAELVQALDSPNGWQRDTAQRLLVQSRDKAAVAPLQELALDCPHPKARLQALCALEGLGALSPQIILQALKDSHPSVREHAIQLSEPLLQRYPEVALALLDLSNDPDIRVRYQLAFTLGNCGDPRSGIVLAKMALNATNDDARLQIAIMSSAPGHVDTMLSTVTDLPTIGPEHSEMIEQLANLAASLNEQPALSNCVHILGGSTNAQAQTWQFSALKGLLDGLNRRKLTLAQFKDSSGPAMSEDFSRLENIFAAARRAATDASESIESRIPAIGLLGRRAEHEESDIPVLGELLGAQNPQTIQDAALDGLRKLRGERAGVALVVCWKSSGPTTQRKILDALVSRPEWRAALLEAIESGKISAGAVSTSHQQVLLRNSDKATRARASKLFAASNADRQGVVHHYETALHLKGDPAKGRGYFRQLCTPCHRLENEGNTIGPDLGSVAFKPVDYLMTAILDPNQSVEERYISYNVVTKGDQEYTGVITAETANSVNLRIAGGAEIPILRSDLKSLTSTGRSLMPDGLENSLDPQALADVIAYLRSSPSSAQR